MNAAAGDRVVDRLVAPDDLEDAERDRDDHREDRRDADEEQRLRQLALDLREDGLVLLVRVTEVQVEDEALDVLVELLPDRQVVPVDLVEVVDLDRGRALAERGAGGAARDDVREEEDQQRHAEDDDDRLDDSADQVAGHGRWVRAREVLSPGCRRHALPAPETLTGCYFVKYQFSGLIARSGLSGVAPARFFCISTIWNAWFGCQTTGRFLAR